MQWDFILNERTDLALDVNGWPELLENSDYLQRAEARRYLRQAALSRAGIAHLLGMTLADIDALDTGEKRLSDAHHCQMCQQLADFAQQNAG